MILFYVAIFVSCIYKLKFNKNAFFDDFIGKNQCESVKGIFILLVFVRHVTQYVVKSGYAFDMPGDQLFRNIDIELNQFIVVMFLFYSGYGVMESITRKGVNYVKGMPLKRILPTILNFDVAVLFFIGLGLCLDTTFTIPQILKSFIAWEDVGNSNWYIFVIVINYMIACFAHFVQIHSGKSVFYALLLSSCLGVAVMVILFYCKQPHWGNTMLAFQAGMVFSYNKKKIVPFIQRYWLKSLVVLLCLFVILFNIHYNRYNIRFNAMSILLALFLVTVNMKVKIENAPLKWLGIHLFPLYIYQRLPMIALFEWKDGTFVRDYALVYIVICFAITLVFACFYKYWQISLKK